MRLGWAEGVGRLTGEQLRLHSTWGTAGAFLETSGPRPAQGECLSATKAFQWEISVPARVKGTADSGSETRTMWCKEIIHLNLRGFQGKTIKLSTCK